MVGEMNYVRKIRDWQHILQLFSVKVKKKEYSKIQYTIWRSINKIWLDVEIHYCSDSPIIVVRGPDSLYDKYAFSTEDHSFGEFLYNEFLMEGNIYYTTDSTSSITINPYSNITATYQYPSNGYCGICQPVEKEKNIAKEENKTMNLFKNFDFGSCENDNVRLSMYGIAVKNPAGTYVAYDKEKNTIFDVDVLNFDAKCLYKIPVAIKDVAVGDVIIHNRKPVYVIKIEDGTILSIDPAAGEQKVILLTKSPFGFDFVTKIVNLLGDFTKQVSADAPFGNILPFLMLSEGKNNDLIPLLLMSQGNTNPMLMYMAMKDHKDSDLLPLMFLMNSGNSNAGSLQLPLFDNSKA